MSEVSEGSDFSGDRKVCHILIHFVLNVSLIQIAITSFFFLLIQICFRHSCRTKFIGSLNKKLTNYQKSFIEATPFAWLVELKESVKIFRNILSLLISRWVERLGGLTWVQNLLLLAY